MVHMDPQTTPARYSILMRRRPAASACKVIRLDAYRRQAVEPPGDSVLNGEWDRLARLAEEAWSWRDPESLAELGACVARLGLRSLEEWAR
jgi:hypothetical protein